MRKGAKTKMARKIVVTSGKGGVGKTTVCANIGIALAKRSHRVLLVDLDLGLNNLDVVMGVENKIVYDLVDVVECRCRAQQAIVQDENEPTLYTLSSCHTARRQVTPDAVNKVINRLSDSFEYIFIDCPAGIDVGFRRAVNCADEAIVVVTPHLSSVRDADKTVGYLKDCMTYVGVVVNRVRGDLIADGEMLSAYEVFSLLGGTPLGIVPENDDINVCDNMYRTNKPFELLADNLVCGTKKMYDCVSTFRGIFGKLKRRLKRHK